MENYYSEDELVLDGNILTYFLTAHAEFIKKQDNLRDFKVEPFVQVNTYYCLLLVDF